MNYKFNLTLEFKQNKKQTINMFATNQYESLEEAKEALVDTIDNVNILIEKRKIEYVNMKGIILDYNNNECGSCTISKNTKRP